MKNSSRYFFEILITTIVVIFLFAGCTNNLQSDSQENNIKNKNLSVLVEIFINETQANYSQVKYDYSNYFYLVRLFSENGNNYLTIECIGTFPYIYQLNEQYDYYCYDKDLMFYYKLDGNNVIIMDSTNLNNNELFYKSRWRNKIIFYVEKNTKTNASPQIDGDTFINYKTFMIKNEENISFIQMDTCIFSPPYASEKKMEYQILEIK